MRRPSSLTLLAGAALAVALALWGWRAASDRGGARAGAAPPPATSSGRPREAPGPGAAHPTVAEPTMPTLTPTWRREVTARVEHASAPGAAAFRAMSDLYVDRNPDFARAQAEAEHITLAEVRELTHLGLLVLATQRVPEVEEVLGHELDDTARRALGQLMRDANDDFKRELRALVAAGKPEPDRWALIRATEADYLARFAAITGITADQQDALLGGNILLPGAPIAGAPADDGADHPQDSPGAPPRPAVPR